VRRASYRDDATASRRASPIRWAAQHWRKNGRRLCGKGCGWFAGGTEVERHYRDEDVLQYTKKAFADTIALKVQHLRRYVKKGTNSALTGSFIEELVRGHVQNWLGHRLLVHGTFYSSEFEESEKSPLQIDGIVYDPTSGPMIIHEGSFAVVHPVFCTGVIEIKTSLSGNLWQLQERLRLIHTQYMHHVSKSQIMGIVISDPDPQGKSTITDEKGNSFLAHYYHSGNWCPIFVLFKEKDFEYEPFGPAVDAMIRAIYTNQWIGGHYL
jgi:hypothetical protein